MRLKSRRNPKGMSLTPEQEAEYERYEGLMARARMMREGVAKMLNDSQNYPSTVEIEEAARMLNESIAIYKTATEARAEVRRAAEPVPAPRKKKVKTT